MLYSLICNGSVSRLPPSKDLYDCFKCMIDDRVHMQNGQKSRFKLGRCQVDTVFQHSLEELPKLRFICEFDRIPIHWSGLTKERCEHRPHPRLLNGNSCPCCR